MKKELDDMDLFLIEYLLTKVKKNLIYDEDLKSWISDSDNWILCFDQREVDRLDKIIKEEE